MSTRENIQLIERYSNQVFNEGRVEAADELLTDDYVNHHAPPGMEGTREGFKQFVTMVHGAMDDFENTTQDIFGVDDKVVQRWKATGKHTGDFMGAPASGNRVEFDGISIYRIEDGKIAEDWTRADLMGLMQQIGAIPEAA